MLRPFREEFQIGEVGGPPMPARKDRPNAWDSELFIFRAADRAGLLHRARAVQDFLNHHADVELKDLAYTLNIESTTEEKCLALVAGSSTDLHARLARAVERLADPARTQISDATGIYYFDRPLHDEGSLALLFPGEGSPFLNMLTDLSPHFPEIEEILEDAERRTHAASPAAGHAFRRIFQTPSDASKEERVEAEKALHQLDAASFSVMLADWAMFRLLSRLGLKPAAMAGHSMGEVCALQAAGCLDAREDLLSRIAAVLDILLSRELGGEIEPAVLLAVGAGKEIVEQVMRDSAATGTYLAMDNCPHQSVVVGPQRAMVAMEAELQKRRLICERLPFDRPYHTPLFESYLGPLCELFDTIEFRAPVTSIYSCSTGVLFPNSPDEIRRLAVWHYAMPVEFTRLIKNMHADGVRIFVECGARGILTAFTQDILRGERFAAIASNVPYRSGITQLNHLAAQLAAHRAPLNLEYFYSRRDPQRVDGLVAGESHSIRVATRIRAQGDVETRERALGDNRRGDEHAAVLEGEGPSAVHAANRVDDPATNLISSARSEVVMQHFAVMEQFLGDQSETINAYLDRVRQHARPRREVVEARAERPSLDHLPMLRSANIIGFEARKQIVVRRKLDMREDLFASHHTVGGQTISKVDPDQHGLPVVPMTFSLEMMAELASILVPNHTVVCLKRIQLFRWLAYDEEVPSVIELRARVISETALGRGVNLQVQVEIREIVGGENDTTSRGPAAQGVVVFGERYAEPPPPSAFPLSNEHPSAIPVNVMYKNLFHGPMFQGAQAGGRSGDEGIEKEVLVLPRDRLLAANPDPDFLLDPVLLDVSMHPITAWHLEFADQSGRILLPIELDRLEQFGPRPPVGTAFVSRASIITSSYRNFSHAVDLLDQNGRLWSRMHRLTFWRFYVPFAKVNFHGPKDEYFISQEWNLAVPPLQPASCIRLEIPPDQKQAAMRAVTAKVILAPDEFRQFQAMVGDEQAESQWLFDRLAGKDAIRLLWHSRHGERLFPADIIIESDETGELLARRRGAAAPGAFPIFSTARSGDVAAALAVFGPYAGISLAHLPPDPRVLQDAAFRAEELDLLDRFGADRNEWATRLWCAKQALTKALVRGAAVETASMSARDADTGTGRVAIKLDSTLGDFFPQWRSGMLIANTARDGNLVVATSFCERVP